jgi:glycosyltransferase involved in cell wall biosynthesis
MVGTFPPPIHGMSSINESVRRDLLADGHEVRVINVAAKSLDRGLISRLTKLARSFMGWARLYKLGIQHSRALLYLAMSGGAGQLYDGLFLLIGRLRKLRRVVHHHSYAYLDNDNLLTRAVINLAGRDTVHVVLSREMAVRLTQNYGVSQVRVVSNAIFQNQVSPRSRTNCRAIGFLGNICAAKGIEEFIEVAQSSLRRGIVSQVEVAGPCQEPEWQNRIHDLERHENAFHYHGAVYGVTKERFFDAIDVLVFPTKYANEAEPLVVLEALSRGIPVVAWDRGAVGELIVDHAGRVVPREQPFVDRALQYITELAQSPVVFQEASRAAAASFVRRHVEARQDWLRMKSEMFRS